MPISNCKSCNAEIVWMKTKNDKNIPVDADTCSPEDTLFDKAHMKAHFDSCTFSDKHRGQAQRQQTPPSGDSSINAKRLNAALSVLEDIAKSSPDGIRSQNLAAMTLTQIRGMR